MTQAGRHYDHHAAEQRWYAHWLKQGFFEAVPDAKRKPYTVIMPPPNVTGRLHMGHVLNNTIQDVLVRKARMEGKVVCWVPGLDHASIATEAKVVAHLKAQGIEKHTLSREAFLTHAWAWKEKYGGIILAQLKKLGVSCDWKRTRFTLDPEPSQNVVNTFVQLYTRGRIYRSTRMVHWDPQGQTTLSDEEVQYQQVEGKLYYIRYKIVASETYLTVATTRPETLLGDVALCVHPEDARYKHLHGRQVVVPIVNRVVPIIVDDYVDPDFGTGCLKITPAHDINDYKIGKKHQLPLINILSKSGALTPAAQHYVGEDRFVARKKIVQQLSNEGALVKAVTHLHQVGISERTAAIVEPRLSTQWFVSMDKLKKPALARVLAGDIQFHPAKFKNRYKAWLLETQDWCISRQLWWGHRIPAYYLDNGEVIVAPNKERAVQEARKKTGNPNLMAQDLRQDEDVLDTWFSSWLWPMSVFAGEDAAQRSARDYFYPTNDLVTAPEIIFFWVARMIMAGDHFTQQPPFKNVYFTGIVRDEQGQKMSKSLGNSPEPMTLIAQYGADSVRVGMLLSTSAGNDLLFDIQHCAQGRNFANKLWNAVRLVKQWTPSEKVMEHHHEAVAWFEEKLNDALKTTTHCFKQFRISEALMILYKLVWDDFCAWYLEMIKPSQEKMVATHVYTKTVHFLEDLLKTLHPFMPFLTEELWHQLRPRTEKDCLTVAPWPQHRHPSNTKRLTQALATFTLITTLRKLRREADIKPNQPLPLCVQATGLPQWLAPFKQYVGKLALIEPIIPTLEIPPNTMSCSVQGAAFYLVLPQRINIARERERLTKALSYAQGFLASVEKKLSNKQFMHKAPASIITLERKKKRDAQQQCEHLRSQLTALTPTSEG